MRVRRCDDPQLVGVEAARGCYEAALHYGTPFISGKDSLNNEYTGPDGRRRAIPGTLLISSIAIHPDVRKAVTMDLKAAGNSVFLVGGWQPFWAGTHAAILSGSVVGRETSRLPGLNDTAPQVYKALHLAMQAGFVRAAHDLSEGGLAVAAAEMSIAGRLGIEIDLFGLDASDQLALFGETSGCLLVEVAPEHEAAFEKQLAGLPQRRIGRTLGEAALSVRRGEKTLFSLTVTELVEAFKAHV